MPLPPPRRESFHFSPTGTNPPGYGSLVARANDFIPRTLTFTQNEKGESLTVRSTSSYSYSESTNSVQHSHQSPLLDAISSCTAPTPTNSQAQERKVSALKLTPVTIPDPPAHTQRPKTRTPGSPPLTHPPPRGGPTASQPLTQAASPAGRSGPESLEPSGDTAALEGPDRAPGEAKSPAPAQVEITKAPPALPPRPSPAVLLVHDCLHTVTKALVVSPLRPLTIQDCWDSFLSVDMKRQKRERHAF